MALPPHLSDIEGRLLGRVNEAFASFRRAIEERLREVSTRLASLSSEIETPSLENLLSDIDPEALAREPRREGERGTLDALLAAARESDRAATQADVLDALLRAATRWSDRSLLLLTREQELVVWRSRGFADDAGSAGRSFAWTPSLREGLLGAATRRLDPASAAPLAAELGFQSQGEVAVVPLVLRDRTAALLWAERATEAPETAALQLLTHLAAQRLELQALSERAATPTLYDEPLEGVEVLPLWEPAPPAEEERSPSPEGPGGMATTLEAPLPRPEIEAEAPPEEEPLWEPATEPEEAAAAPPVDPAAASAPGVEEVEPPAEAEAPPEPEDSAGDVDFELADAAEPQESPDVLGTVRLAVPMPVTEPPPVEPAAAPPGTLESPAPEPPPAPPPPPEEPTQEPPQEPSTAPGREPEEEEIDLSEDATILTMRRPSLTPPVAPPAPAPPPPAADDPADRTASRMARSTEVAPPPGVQGPGLAFSSFQAGRAAAEPPLHEEAKRLARLLISEIKLYNEEQVMEGRRNHDLYHRLKEDIDRSRQIYEERVDDDVRTETDYFQQELVRSLAGGDPRVLGI